MVSGALPFDTILQSLYYFVQLRTRAPPCRCNPFSRSFGPEPGLVSPQFHAQFDDHFDSLRDESKVPVPKSMWQIKWYFEASTQASVGASAETTAPQFGFTRRTSDRHQAGLSRAPPATAASSKTHCVSSIWR